MFLIGILSGPLPYLLLAAFYLFGFMAGMFQKETAQEEINSQVQVNNIHFNDQSTVQPKGEKSFYFHQYKVEKKAVHGTLKMAQPPLLNKEKLIYFVHDIKIPHTSLSDFYFCRPPPIIG